ncbi:pyruvate kinase, partial [Candidatus Sumerlaeota bacterium]
MARTKIVATLGPASWSEASIAALIRAGVDVFRLNFSHGSPEEHQAAIQTIRRLKAQKGQPIAILGDLPGRKIRLGNLAPSPLTLDRGDGFVLASRKMTGGVSGATVRYPTLSRDVGKGNEIALGDGAVLLRVKAKSDNHLECVVERGGEITSGAGVHFPGARLSVKGLTGADRLWTKFAAEQKIDWLAVSFVRTSREIRSVRRILGRNDCEIPVIAKIENREAVDNLGSIVREADGAMV